MNTVPLSVDHHVSKAHFKASWHNMLFSFFGDFIVTVYIFTFLFYVSVHNMKAVNCFTPIGINNAKCPSDKHEMTNYYNIDCYIDHKNAL